jgi:hypothetical protein
MTDEQEREWLEEMRWRLGPAESDPPEPRPLSRELFAGFTYDDFAWWLYDECSPRDYLDAITTWTDMWREVGQGHR